MKIKSLYLIVFTLCFLAKGKAQLYDSLGSGISNVISTAYFDSILNKLFVTTLSLKTNDGLTIAGVGSWNGSNWDSLQKGFLPDTSWIGDVPTTASSIVRYKDKVYFGGNFLTCNGTYLLHRLVTWDGTQWDSLPFTPPGAVSGLIVWRDTLYVSGVFNNIGPDSTIKYIAKWDGTNWHSVGNIFDLIAGGPVINVMEVYNDELYLGGTIYDHFSTPKHLVKWDGFNWTFVGSGINQGGIGMVRALEVFNDELYIGGYFSAAAASGTSSYLTKWNGTEYKDIGGFGLNDACVAICNHNSKLYVGGFFTDLNGMPARCFASFDGTKWCSYPTISVNGVIRLISYKDSLIMVGGIFVEGSDTLSEIVKWKGDAFSDTCKLANNILEQEPPSIFSLYPNPGSGIFTLSSEVKFENLSICILNSLGELVLQKQAFGGSNIELDISTQPSGIYLVQLTSPRGIVTLKIVKQ